MKWRLGYFPMLERWVSEEGSVVVLGDAAHAMLPNLAQGAAMGLEDGVAMAECLDKVHELGMVGCLRAWEVVRKGRCEAISRASMAVGERKFGGDVGEDGEAKKRDDEFRGWLYGNDTVREVSVLI